MVRIQYVCFVLYIQTVVPVVEEAGVQIPKSARISLCPLLNAILCINHNTLRQPSRTWYNR
jgi:hypothetical protein